MAGPQTDNIMLLDLTTGLPRTPETGVTPDVLQLSTDFQLISGANLLVDGNLVVNGTTTTIHSEQVNIRDNHLYLNADYTTAVAQTGGFVVNVLPTATADTVAASGFTAGVAAVSNPTVVTSGTGTFAAGDIIQISGANNQANDGLYEVLSHVGTTLTVRGIGVTATTQDWFQDQFVTDATAGGDIRIVNVNVLRGTSTGTWETFTGATSIGLTYTAFTAQGIVDLQEAYEQGNTITTSLAEGNVTIAGSESLVITATAGLNVDTVADFDVTQFDVDVTGAGFSLDANAASNVSVAGANLALNTSASGSVLIDGVSGVEINSSAGALSIGNDANAFAINIGTGAAARTITVGNSTGASAVDLVSGTGAFSMSSTVGEDTPVLTLTATGTAGDSADIFVGDNSPNGAVTGQAGSLFLRDTGTGGQLWINNSTGSGTVWEQVLTATSVNLQTAYEGGNTITTSAGEGDITFTGTEDFVVTLANVLVDTTASISLDAAAASNFSVDGANLTLSTTTSGDVLVSSAGELDLTSTGLLDVNAGANLDVDVTGTMDFLSTGAFSIDGNGASNVSATSGNLTLSTITSGAVDITSANDIQMTFQANNATAMVIDDGINNFITFDSTTGSLAIEMNQFLDLVGEGAGITLTAGVNITAGDVVALNTSGQAILADANTGTDSDAYVIGVAATTATAGNPVRVFTVTGSLIPVQFVAAPAAALNGSVVFVSQTAGRGTTTAPTGGGNIIYKIGILQGADGADTSPNVIFQPQYLSKRP
jgi:hypothetical protein